jgi:ABC-type amino acid transport substrate-binding protein
VAGRRPNRPKPRPGRWSDVGALAVVAAILLAVGFLPPDTALAEVRRDGVLRACVPTAYPPLVTGDPTRPGIDLELLGAVADALGVRLLPVANGAMGGDFDPRNWRVTRAQCLVLGGGVVDAPVTRGFLSIAGRYADTGWAAVAREPGLSTLRGARVGFFAGLSGLDRIALSRWLRDRGARVEVVGRSDDLRSGWAAGDFDVVISESLTARSFGAAVDRVAVQLPVGGGRVPLGFGFWKGDLTLERAVDAAVRDLHARGVVATLLERYGVGDLTDDCGFCD